MSGFSAQYRTDTVKILDQKGPDNQSSYSSYRDSETVFGIISKVVHIYISLAMPFIFLNIKRHGLVVSGGFFLC